MLATTESKNQAVHHASSFLPQGMFASVQATMVGWKPARISKHFAGSEAQGNSLSGRGKGQACVLGVDALQHLA